MLSKTLLTSTLIAAVSAHQNFHQFWVNGETPGYQVGIRMPPSNSPVTDVTSNDIACNVDGSKVPSGVETVAASEGDTIKVQWDSSSHPGPITHMLFGPVDDASSATGVGSWVKIDELDYVNGTWANEIMLAANMTHEFKLPTGLASGQYLLRSEMLALHGAQTVGGAQFYIGCAQLRITGSGGSCSPSIKLPGAYNAEDPNIYIPNVYNGFDPTNYTAPGGPVAQCGGSGSSSRTTSAAPAPSSSAIATTPTNDTIASSTIIDAASSAVVATPTDVASTPSAIMSLPASTTAAVVSSAVPSLALPSTFVTSIASSSNSTSAIPAPVQSGGSGAVAKKYYQCGGINWTGATACETGSTCTKQNDYYHQCL